MSAKPSGCLGGLHEVCVGVPDLVEAIAFYEAFGCRVGAIGELDAGAARSLYGVDSALRSVRLLHQQADHGLIRLMQWERPLNDGLGLTRTCAALARAGACASPPASATSSTTRSAPARPASH